MNINIFDEYYDYKLKIVYQYSVLLSKIIGIDKNKLWHRRKDLEDSLKEIIKIYFSLSGLSVNKYLTRYYINNKDVFRYNIDEELFACIRYFIDKERGFEISAYEKEIVLTASIVHIANEIDVATSPYKRNSKNYKTILIGLIEKYNNIDFFNIIDDGKKNISLLLELVKTNVRKERRLFELLTNRNSFNKYINIGNNSYFITQYNYSIPDIDKYDKYASELVFKENDYDDQFLLISADNLMITFMKMLSIRKKMKTFFIPLKKEFVNNAGNLNKLVYLFNNKFASKYVNVLINYNDYSLDLLKELVDNNINFYVYCNSTTRVIDNNKLKGCSNYLITRDFYTKNKKTVVKWQQDNLNLLKENFTGLLTDTDLIEM